MGAETDAARAEVLASRAALLEEVHRLEASARAAVDIPGKIKRQPAKTAGLAAGAAFVALGGPQRLFRRGRRLVLGPKADLPKSMLPKDVEKTLRKLGTDGDHVRSVLEREFARYLADRSKMIRKQDSGANGNGGYSAAAGGSGIGGSAAVSLSGGQASAGPVQIAAPRAV